MTQGRTRDEIREDVARNYRDAFLDTFYACGGDEEERDEIADDWQQIRRSRQQTTLTDRRG